MKKLNNLPRHERAAAAAFWGNSWCIEELYMQDCPVNATNLTGFTPLHIAARFDYVDCVKCLLNIGNEKSSGINVNAETEGFLTPLRVALASNSLRCAELLVKAGGIEKIPREKSGVRTVLDMDEVLQYKWPEAREGNAMELGAIATCPDDYKFKRSTDRAIDNLAQALERQSILNML